MPRNVLIVGGIGYLGYNLALEHSRHGDSVYIVARRSSAERREKLFNELRSFVKKSILLGSLGDRVSIRSSIDSMGCPDIAYLATGKLAGTHREMEEAHVEIPAQWTRILSQRCRNSLIVYVSSVFSVGDPASCARDLVVQEEEKHLEGCKQFSSYARTKAAGERRVLELCRGNRARVVVLRPGLLIGRWSYHREWRLMYRLAKLHLRVTGGPYLHVTPARDVARAAILLSEQHSGCQWYYATPWRVRLGELHSMLLQSLEVRHALPLYVPSMLPLGSLAKELKAQQQYRIEPWLLNRLGMKWTSLEEAVGEAAEWMRREWGGEGAESNARRYSVVIV